MLEKIEQLPIEGKVDEKNTSVHTILIIYSIQIHSAFLKVIQEKLSLLPGCLFLPQARQGMWQLPEVPN